MDEMNYNTPAEQWIDGLPVGNGRLACMVWGGSGDRLTLNHEWLWTGRNRHRRPEETAQGLPLVRRFIREGNHYMATLLANALFAGKGGRSGLKGRVDDYQPAGELQMELEGNPTFRSRSLILSEGIVSTDRCTGETDVHTEVFADCRNGCIGASWCSEGKFSGRLSLSREQEAGTELKISAEGNTLRLYGSISGGICFAVLVTISTDGSVFPEKNSLKIAEASFVRCAINMATDHGDLEQELKTYLFSPDAYETIRRNHREQFRQLMHTVDFRLESSEARNTLPTDVRIRRLRDGETDNGISELYFHFGRYLLISASVCGELPANLQGKWNNSLTPSWNCDYHFDINLEMNYWMAESAGLGACIPALVRFVRSFLDSGRQAARSLYNCRGICLPIQTDAWGVSTPESMGWGAWIGAAPWIARTLWEHYRYSGDREYLRSEAYEFFRLVAEFYQDYLQKDENGIYQILPSQSPENTIAATGALPVLIDQSSAMDVQLCYDSLGYAIASAELLGVDGEKAELWKEMQAHLPPFAIGSDGRLMEWQQEYPESQPGHRHLSHLYGLYPSDLFTPQTRPAQYQAAKASLASRLAHGGGHTGWSRAWVACLSARIGDSAAFYEHYTAMIRDFATDSLLDLHPPRVFQIDGNLGGAAAVMEAVVSFYDETAHLLQGIPAQWRTGHLFGARIPGGHSLNVAWENGQVSLVEVTLGFSGLAQIAWENQTRIVRGNPGEKIRLVSR